MTPDAEVRCRRVAARRSDTQHPCVVLNNSSAPVTFVPPNLTLTSWVSANRWAPDWTPQIAVHCDRVAQSLPAICSKCVEPSVSKTGRPWFPFSLGLISLFSGASLLPEWLLGLGSGPTEGFLKWRSWDWSCWAHLLQAWGPSIINGATSTGDFSDIQPWPKDWLWKIENFSVLQPPFLSLLFSLHLPLAFALMNFCPLITLHISASLSHSVSCSPSFCLPVCLARVCVQAVGSAMHAQ